MSADLPSREHSVCLPEKNGDYGCLEYWEDRYEREESFDWFVGYAKVKDILSRHVRTDDSVLNLGCGNSTLAEEMWSDGFHDITNIDYSTCVIESMRRRTSRMIGLRWLVADIFKMSEKFLPESFDVVIEKGTLDAFLVGETDPWNYSEEAAEMMDRILQQVSDLLKPGGRFVSITFCQPHFRFPFYAVSKYGWSVAVETFGDGLQYFCYVLTKGESLGERDEFYVKSCLKRREDRLNPVQTLSSDDDEDYLLKIDGSLD